MVAEAVVATVHITSPVFPTSMGSRMLKKSWLKAVLCSRARLPPCGDEAARARALKSFAVISRMTSTAAILAVTGSSCALSNNTAVNELNVLNSILGLRATSTTAVYRLVQKLLSLHSAETFHYMPRYT